MVWSSTQSALYKAVDDFNSGNFSCEKREEKFTENSCGKIADNLRENHTENSGKKRCENSCEKCCKKCGYFSENSHKNCQKTDPVSRILSDKDMLLIAGLIFILINEKADSNLILALLIVLLG